MAFRITFVHAPLIRYDQNYGTLFSPVWAYTLAAHVPAQWQITILDTIVDDLAEVQPADIFAFSGINQDIDSMRAAYDAVRARYPEATCIVGGPITWSYEQDGKLGLLDQFDHIFILDGEETLPQFLNDFSSSAAMPKIVRASRVSLTHAKPIAWELMREKAKHYYGAVVEVSRGCPFLCEFCDIRVLPGNNRANNKRVQLIIDELDAYWRLGVNQFQFACDNFIGDTVWARECVDAILAWKARTGADISIFTWLTINLYKLPELMEKMRLAGFSILFIGVESVNQNSLLETAKVQNVSSLGEAVKIIHSHGFVIAPGFIFGFDSDTESVFDDTLEFMADTGLIGGDPSFLTALPGTPLFARMKRSGRLIEAKDAPTVRMKITTNIRYLLGEDFLAEGFVRFMKHYNSPGFQLRRFNRHLDLIVNGGHFVPIDGVGYGSPREYLKIQFRNPENRRMLFKRLAFLLSSPANVAAAIRGWFRVKRLSKTHKGLGIQFNYWVYVWTNMAIKYERLVKTDFALHSVAADFDFASLIAPESPAANVPADVKLRGDEKKAHQARYTNRALKALVEDRAARAR